MTGRDAIDLCWADYMSAIPAGNPIPAHFDAWPFGADGEDELADELAELVVRGIKTATSSLLTSYEDEPRPIEQIGEHSVVLMSTGEPRCVIEMTEVRTLSFDQVDADFSADYGEGERTLAWWREHLGDYYAAEAAAHGRSFSGETPLVCKRFRVVHRCGD